MPYDPKSDRFCQILGADIRFSLPDAMNDQVWEFCPGKIQPRALSLLTTYGFRASRMHVFPVFTVEDRPISDPVDFSVLPEVFFSSTNFMAVQFSPFQDIDVILRLWVPTSQIILGELTCINAASVAKTIGIDWLAHLTPVAMGSPMKQTQMGLSTVLQGECADLFPVFYLAGGAYASSTSIPGLSSKLLLMPSSEKRLTWALASHSSIDASFQQARQYSSRSLEVEQLKIEMTDKRELLRCQTVNPEVTKILARSNIRARQFILPALQQFYQPTYMTVRDVNTGSYPRPDIIEINPGWNGQTLPEIIVLADNLLPGNPEVIKGLLQNQLKHQATDGSIDHQVGPNGSRTGHPALPLLAQLVADLNNYMEDTTWLEEVYPRLVAFLGSWLTLDADEKIKMRELSHPVQLGIDLTSPKAELLPSDLWIRLKSSDNNFVPALLYREVSALLQLARQLQKDEEIQRLERLQNQLRTHLERHWNNKTATMDQPDSYTGLVTKGLIIHQYKRNGQFKPACRLPRTGRIFVRLHGEHRLPPRFTCHIRGISANEPVEIVIHPTDLLPAGQARVCVTTQCFSTVDAIEIVNLPAGSHLEIGQADLLEKDLTAFLSLYAGFLTPQQVTRFLRTNPIGDHLSARTGVLLDHRAEESLLPAPGYLVKLIIEGFLRYGKINLAHHLYHCHFIARAVAQKSVFPGVPLPELKSLDDLALIRLFLKIHGVVRITGKEVILSHFIKRKQDAVTVQYNKVELRVKPYVTEICTQTGEVIYLNRAGPNRVILE